MNRTVSRGLRTLLQLVAAGGLTALFNAIADGLSPNLKSVVLALNLIGITLAQNFLESAGKVPTLLEDAHAREVPPTGR